ncbi:MAG TPA: glycosyltransferase family 39 protein [Gemmataceae bacterium]|nr:glycosyltransferase family 39 protein [Gemmataceae bacterium]
MEEQPVPTHFDEGQTQAAGRWRDVALVALLLVFAVGLRGWLLTHTEVVARDSIGYIRYALEFESESWSTVLRNNHQHPGYPLTVLAVSAPVRAYGTGPASELMSLSARLASNLAAVLLVIPMYFLGRLLFHRAVGFGASALFQCLPVPAHVLSDGLSEALFLLLACATLCFVVVAMRGSRPWLFALCGVFSGLAYLTRPEGALLAAATLFVLIGLKLMNVQQRSWRQIATCGASMTLMAGIVSTPYLFATHSISNKPSIHQMFRQDSPAAEVAPAGPQTGMTTSRLQPLLASTFGITLNLQDTFGRRARQAVVGLGGELVKCFHYFAWIAVLLGMWWFRRQAFTEPGMWVLLVLSGTYTLVLWWLAVHVGYMSDRHLLLLVMLGCYPAVAAVGELPKRCLTRWNQRLRSSEIGQPVEAPRHNWRTLAAACAVFCIMVGGGLPKTLERLHANRAGHHAAGLWLADNSAAVDLVEDDHCWAHYYAGRVFQERKTVTAPPGHVQMRYVVVGRRDREINLTWNRSGPLSEAKLRAEGGQIVYHWPAAQSSDDAPIVIYAVPPAPPPQPPPLPD